MNLSGFQEQRAKNMIWNAASDYHFLPDYAAYDRNGEPSFYFNCIIGYVHRYYDYALLEDLFLRLGRLREANLYRNLINRLSRPVHCCPHCAMSMPWMSGNTVLLTGIRNFLNV